MTDDRGLSLLTGPDAAGLLAAALADSGLELVTWQVRQVDHRPGTSTTVSYDATVRGPAGPARQVLGASAGLPAPGPGTVGGPQTGGRAGGLAVWCFPLDPDLPGLATATDEAAVRAVLATLGVRAAALRLDVRAYRPRRRAVVEVRGAGLRLLLKVVPPGVVAGLDERHRLLRAAGVPVPRSLGRSEDGLLVLQALPGTPLRERLRAGGHPAPDGDALLALLDRLPRELCALPLRRSWTDDADHYARVLAAALPDEGPRAHALAARVTQRTAGVPAVAPSHGDFYEAQLLLDGARVSGLLDVDAAGPGRRADDLACLLAHVSVLALTEPVHRTSTRALLADWEAAFERTVDPHDLRARTAGVVLSLATGPHRVQEDDWPAATRARLDLAEQWLSGVGGTGRPPARR